MVRNWKTDPNTIRAIVTVNSNLDLNSIADCEKPHMVQDNKTIGSLCCISGPVSASLRTNK